MTKNELIKRGAHYFDSKDVKVMYATEDGNFFYEKSKGFGDSHAKTKNIELFTITRADLSKKKTEKEEEVEVKAEEKEKVNEEQATQINETEEETPKNKKSKKSKK